MNFRKATEQDLPAIVNMIALDKFSKQIEKKYSEPISEAYYKAFYKIDTDKNQELIVVVNNDNEVIGTFQLTFIQYLTYQGSIRAQIESVRVREDMQGTGIGQKMFEWAINRAKNKNANLLLLTVDRRRPGTSPFMKNLASNLLMKV